MRNSPGQENQGVDSTIPQEPVTQPVASSQDTLGSQPPKKKKKEKKEWKLMKSIKNMFGGEKKGKNQQNTTGGQDGLAPLTRKKPEGLEAQFASAGGIPTYPPVEILERKVPEVPKPSLKDYLEKENTNKNLANRPEPVRVPREIIEKPATPPPQNNLADQYRSVGSQPVEQIKKPAVTLRLSDMTKGNVVVRDFGEIEKETPDWKANQITNANGGFFGQNQQDLKSLSMGAPVNRRFENAPGAPLYKYR